MQYNSDDQKGSEFSFVDFKSQSSPTPLTVVDARQDHICLHPRHPQLTVFSDAYTTGGRGCRGEEIGLLKAIHQLAGDKYGSCSPPDSARTFSRELSPFSHQQHLISAYGEMRRNTFVSPDEIISSDYPVNVILRPPKGARGSQLKGPGAIGSGFYLGDQ